MKIRTSSQHMFLWCDCAILNFPRVWAHRVSLQVDPICAGAQLLWEMTVVALLGVRAFSSPGTNLSSTNQVYFSGPKSQLFPIHVFFKVWSEGRLRESQEEASPWCCYYVYAPNPCECAWECSWFWRGQELPGLCLWSLSLSAFCFSPSPGRNTHGIRSKQPRQQLGEYRITLDISPPLSPNAFWGCAHDSSGIQTPANGVGELCMTLPRRNGPVYTLCKSYLKWSLHLEIVTSAYYVATPEQCQNQAVYEAELSRWEYINQNSKCSIETNLVLWCTYAKKRVSKVKCLLLGPPANRLLSSLHWHSIPCEVPATPPLQVPGCNAIQEDFWPVSKCG